MIQNDIGNYFSPTVIAAVITSKSGKKPLPTHVAIDDVFTGLTENSTVLLEQVRTLDRSRLREYVGHLTDEEMTRVEAAIKRSLALE